MGDARSYLPRPSPHPPPPPSSAPPRGGGVALVSARPPRKLREKLTPCARAREKDPNAVICEACKKPNWKAKCQAQKALEEAEDEAANKENNRRKRKSAAAKASGSGRGSKRSEHDGHSRALQPQRQPQAETAGGRIGSAASPMSVAPPMRAAPPGARASAKYMEMIARVRAKEMGLHGADLPSEPSAVGAATRPERRSTTEISPSRKLPVRRSLQLPSLQHRQQPHQQAAETGGGGARSSASPATFPPVPQTPRRAAPPHGGAGGEARGAAAEEAFTTPRPRGTGGLAALEQECLGSLRACFAKGSPGALESSVSQEEVERLKATDTAARARIDTLKAQVRSLEAVRADDVATKDDLALELDCLKRTLRSVRVEKSDLETQLEGAEARDRRTSRENEDLEATLHRMQWRLKAQAERGKGADQVLAGGEVSEGWGGGGPLSAPLYDNDGGRGIAWSPAVTSSWGEAESRGAAGSTAQPGWPVVASLCRTIEYLRMHVAGLTADVKNKTYLLDDLRLADYDHYERGVFAPYEGAAVTHTDDYPWWPLPPEEESEQVPIDQHGLPRQTGLTTSEDQGPPQGVEAVAPASGDAVAPTSGDIDRAARS